MSQPPKDRNGIANGQKWVDLNWRAKEEAKKKNGKQWSISSLTSDTDILAGGVLPYSRALVTSDFPNRDVWSIDNLPEVLFYLQLPANPLHDVKPEPYVRQDGRELRRFEVLPDYISVDVEGKSQNHNHAFFANTTCRLAGPNLALP
jgi:hypothetical protein